MMPNFHRSEAYREMKIEKPSVYKIKKKKKLIEKMNLRHP